jgi:hypothetical protein
MKIKNVRGLALEIAATGQIVEPDQEVEVQPEVGASLCEQPANWQAVSAKPSPKVTKQGDDL